MKVTNKMQLCRLEVEVTELNFRVAETLFPYFGTDLCAYMYPVDSATLSLSAVISKCL